MPAPKPLEPTRSLRDLIGWPIRLHRGDWIGERLAHQLSQVLGRQVSGWMISKWETATELLSAEAAAALDQVFKTRGLFTYLQVLAAREGQPRSGVGWCPRRGRRVASRCTLRGGR